MENYLRKTRDSLMQYIIIIGKSTKCDLNQ